MGLFKESLNLSLRYDYLIELGFKYGKTSGPKNETGYTKTIQHNENEILWITINPQEKKVYLYNEWDCGGELWSRTHDIPESILEDKIELINWLDEII